MGALHIGIPLIGEVVAVLLVAFMLTKLLVVRGAITLVASVVIMVVGQLVPAILLMALFQNVAEGT